ncbi:hypothetical protein OKW43_005739 [Paraburkholderia sp. WC7.3g]
MRTHSRCPYRGYGILVQIAEVQSPSFNGTERRFSMSWSSKGGVAGLES